MLKPAQLYKDRLTEEYIKTWYKPENIFYTGWTGDSLPELPDNNYESHHFVSVDENDRLIGYIAYAVDFDKTLNLADTYPELGEPNMELIEFLKERRAAGDKLILWTCREGELLKAAVKYCNDYGLFFHAVNDNLPENIEYYGNNCRKVWAHHYIDDRNMMRIPGVDYVSEREIRQIKLKPCPLCGTLPYTWAERLDDERMKACIQCNNSDCKATVVRVIETKRGLLNFEEIIGGIKEAANTWNRRV